MVVLRESCAVGVWAAQQDQSLWRMWNVTWHGCWNWPICWKNSIHLTASTCPSKEVTHPYRKPVTKLLPFFKKELSCEEEWKRESWTVMSCWQIFFTRTTCLWAYWKLWPPLTSQHWANTSAHISLSVCLCQHWCFGLGVRSYCSSCNSFKMP